MRAAVLSPSPPPVKAGRRRLLMVLGLFALGVAACVTMDGLWRPNDGLLARIRQWRGGHRPWPADGGAGVAESDRGRLALFVLVGQSNMSGRGRVNAGVTTSTRPVYVFGNDDRWHRAIEPVDNGWGQVDRVSFDVVVGVGPGQAFGERWSELNAGEPVGLIPCAMGGSTIENWQRDERATSLYGSMLRRARAAAAQGEIRGVLFFQGESDAVGDRTKPWDEQFLRWAGDLRMDLEKPELPIVFAQLGDGSRSVDPAGWRRLQEIQAAVKLAQCEMITTSDLPVSDDVHFTTDAYRVIGRRFAEAMHRLTRTAGIVSELPP